MTSLATTTERTTANIFTVTSLNQQARNILERKFSRVAVSGEIANLKTVSGHVYFTLRDEQSQLSAVLFRRDAARLKFKLNVGDEITVWGRLTIYPNYGRYQIVADRAEPVGAGAMQVAFEQLKKKLAAEGLFDADRKRALPLLPRNVAVITSPTGAVIRDIANVSSRRMPNASLLLLPARVQGAFCVMDVVHALKRVDEVAAQHRIDAVIVARGGGSTEELWSFNDERLARAIAGCSVPVVSAVGHETDFTISDFVADVRAPTPSAAAELVFPVCSELHQSIADRLQRCVRAVRGQIDDSRHTINHARARMGDARSATREYQQQLSLLLERMHGVLRAQIHSRRRVLHKHHDRLSLQHPSARLARLRRALDVSTNRAVMLTKQCVVRDRRRLAHVAGRLHALSPLATLERGYSIVLDAQQRAVTSCDDVQVGDELQVRLARGTLAAQVTKVTKAEENK